MGTTSACAENTPFKIKTNIFVSNYLRVRGEYLSRLRGRTPHWELPLRARRIPPITPPIMAAIGTTSACAENTANHRAQLSPQRNYLRVRGEYSAIFARNSSAWELPPRARRILSSRTRSAHSRGTTSACAENTAYAGNILPTTGNYLRVRGEYSSFEFACAK